MAEVDDIGGTFATAQSDGFTVETNTENAEALQTNLDSEKAAETEAKEAKKVSEAAETLGKKGGKASAEKRANQPGVVREDDESGSIDGNEDAGDGSKETEKRLGKPRDDPKARMLEATRQAAELKRQLAAKEQELAQERAARAQPTIPQPKAKEDGPPNPADYDDYEKLQEDRIKYWADKRAEEKLAEFKQAQQQEQVASQKAQAVGREIQGFQEKVKKAEEASPGIYARISQDVWDNLPLWWEAAPGEPLTQRHQIAYELVSSLDNPLPILAHFSEHPEEFQRVATLSDSYAITRELAKLDAKLDVATAVTSVKPTISMAKPPVRTVTGSPSIADRSADDMSFEEFYSHEQKRARR